MITVHQTADATSAYRERSALDLAPSTSTALDGTLASFTKNNTLVLSNVHFQEMYPSNYAVYIEDMEEQCVIEYTQR